MRKWHDAERCKAAERHAKAAAAPSTVGISKRPGVDACYDRGIKAYHFLSEMVSE